MTKIRWSLVDAAAQMLEPREREAVLGDLLEAGESAGESLLDVLGLVARRQAALWKSWRPWLAAFGLALPGSLLLMGLSVSVSRSYQQLFDPALVKPAGLLSTILLLIGWSWTGGFVMGSLSRRTVWFSTALCFLPCLFCLTRFRIESLSRFSLLLFLVPAIWGVRQGLRTARMRLPSAIVLTAAIMALTLPNWNWIPDLALSWPAWYLVATARKAGLENGE